MNVSLPHVCVAMILASGIIFAREPTDSEVVAVDADSAIAYVQSCRKPNGAFGPADQEYTDAAWNYPAVATLLLLGKQIAEPQDVIEHGLGYPHGHAGYGHWLFFHQHRIRELLGKPIIANHRRVAIEHQGFEPRYYGSPFGTDGDSLFKAGGRPQPDPQSAATGKFGFYNLSSLYYLLAGLQASGREPANPQLLAEFIRRRQAPGGGFVDLRTENGSPIDDDAHIAHTFHALASLKLLGQSLPHADRCTAFIRGCQLTSGAYGWNPKADLPGNKADVYYTWAALRSLDVLGTAPRQTESCQQWLNSLQNSDGGFGDRPGWRSRLYSTYYAVHSLALLGDNARSGIQAKRVRRPQVDTISSNGWGIYQGLLKTPTIEPDDLEGLSRRGFNLLALKSDKFDDAARLLPAIRQQKLSLDVVLCPEAYPHWLRTTGGLLLNHVGNFTLDSRWDTNKKDTWHRADAAGRQGLPWVEYKQRVVGPLRELGALCYPEQDFEQEHAYVAYDDEAYNAVLVGFNWAPRDFVRVFPWRERYIDKLTPIADVDAHGDLVKWSPQLDHTRLLYIAKGPAYANFLEAVAARRVVCVVAEPEGVPSGATYYGPSTAVEYVRKRVEEWRWWPRP